MIKHRPPHKPLPAGKPPNIKESYNVQEKYPTANHFTGAGFYDDFASALLWFLFIRNIDLQYRIVHRFKNGLCQEVIRFYFKDGEWIREWNDLYPEKATQITERKAC